MHHTYKTLTCAALLLILSVAALAQSSQQRNAKYKIDKAALERAEMLVPRTALHPVKSLDGTKATPMDTLATEDEHIKVVLYADNTWKYVKLPDFERDADIFNKYWDNINSNPYHIDQASLPLSWSIWLVDSLCQYHCPFKGSVNPRGKFGPRRGRRHQGVDLPLHTGDPIYAAFTGRVRISKVLGGYGNLVVIRHENGLETFYGHLSRRDVEVGDWVNAGEVIGLGGSTGRSSGPHLHFETRYQGFAFDPQWLIDFESGELRHRLFVLKKKYFSQYSNYEQDFEDEEFNEAEDKRIEAEEAAKKYYKIRSGDTLGAIAKRNGTTVKKLCQLNGIKETTILSIGRTIRVR